MNVINFGWARHLDRGMDDMSLRGWMNPTGGTKQFRNNCVLRTNWYGIELNVLNKQFFKRMDKTESKMRVSYHFHCIFAASNAHFSPMWKVGMIGMPPIVIRLMFLTISMIKITLFTSQMAKKPSKNHICVMKLGYKFINHPFSNLNGWQTAFKDALMLLTYLH